MRNGKRYIILDHRLIWSWKTTIGNALYYELKKKQDNLIILDGDILKN